MLSRYTKLKFRRKLRHQQRAIEQASDSADKHFEYHVVRRWKNLKDVKRFVIGWLFLVLLLATGVYLQGQNLQAFYQSDQPVPGGTYREGIEGEITNLNPIYASSNVDRAASKLIFNSLFRYDNNGDVTGDLATNWEANDDGTVYTVTLRNDVFWHDGVKVTADDVVFTYKAIQNPDSRSFLNASWQNIVVQAKDERTVTFTLPNPFEPFIHSLTQGGIIPKHVLGNVPLDQLRGNQFNTVSPIGSGPYKFNEIITSQNPELHLVKNEGYYRGEPNINQFFLISYPNQDDMIADFNDGELAAIGGLRGVNEDVINDEVNHFWTDLPLTNGVYIFMKNSDPLFENADMRIALTRATDQDRLLKQLGERFNPVKSALLRGQVGYNEENLQREFNAGTAGRIFKKLGWEMGDDGFRYKDGEQLTVTLTTQNSDFYPQIAEEIKQQWAEVGVKVDILIVDESQVQSTYVIPHNYQVFLSGISIGHDPDVFAYWHSSQSDIGGFNLSEYKSDTADVALEAGRTRTGDELRAIKYQPFVEAWAVDAPAIGLYQPTYVYVQQERATGLKPTIITTPEERYNEVHTWFVNTEQKDIPY